VLLELARDYVYVFGANLANVGMNNEGKNFKFYEKQIFMEYTLNTINCSM